MAQAFQRLATQLCCGAQVRRIPLLAAAMGDVFTQNGRFAQAFTGSLWETWETGYDCGWAKAAFPKLLNCTAGI
jgi:hypothetical protein